MTMETTPQGPADTHSIARLYIGAKRQIVDAGYVDELVWQSDRRLSRITNTLFVREAAWVVLAAGMADRVVRAVFPEFTRAMLDFALPDLVADRIGAERRALSVFSHQGKVRAVLDIAEQVDSIGTQDLKAALNSDPESFLRALPYVGPITWKHLAKNVGVQVSKSDRHMVRLAARLGRPSVDALCSEIAAHVGDPVSVVDIVLWRWCVESARRSGQAAHWAGSAATGRGPRGVAGADVVNTDRTLDRDRLMKDGLAVSLAF